jgi:excisionase family DNA binding protein
MSRRTTRTSARPAAARNRTSREPRWATGLPAASAYAGVAVRTLRDWIAKGWLPAYRIGPRQIQIDLNDIDALRTRIPAANGPGRLAALPPLSHDDIRAVAREVAAMGQEDDGGGEAAGAGQ